MKKRVITLVVALLTSGGAVVYNYSGEDVTLPNGEVVATKELKRSLTKHYKERSIEDSLYITIHHTAAGRNQSLNDIAKFHVEMRGWPEIAYHIAINVDGDINLLNHIEERTYHDSGENTRSIGIVLLGNYENYAPSEKMINSLNLVTDALCKTLKIKGIRAHRDTSPTLCPGEYAYDVLKPMFY